MFKQPPNPYPIFSKKNVIDVINKEFVRRHLNRDPSQYFCNRYNNILNKNEMLNVELAFFQLVKYLLVNNKFIFPENKWDDGKLYRAGKIRAVERNRRNEYYPINKSSSSKCPGDPGTYEEPTYFSSEPLYYYLKLKADDPFGVITCRKINNIAIDPDTRETTALNLLINLSTQNTPTPNCNIENYLLSKSLITAINKCILIIAVKKYCKLIGGRRMPENLSYEWITSNSRNIVFNSTVEGFSCGADYVGGCIHDVLLGWNTSTGKRESYYNADRIGVQVLFEILDIIEYFLNNICRTNQNIVKKKITSSVPGLDPNIRINLIGTWITDTTHTANKPPDKCGPFKAEYTIHFKYLQGPLRYTIFQRRSPTSLCGPKFYIYNPDRGYEEIDEENIPPVDPLIIQYNRRPATPINARFVFDTGRDRARAEAEAQARAEAEAQARDGAEAQARAAAEMQYNIAYNAEIQAIAMYELYKSVSNNSYESLGAQALQLGIHANTIFEQGHAYVQTRQYREAENAYAEANSEFVRVYEMYTQAIENIRRSHIPQQNGRAQQNEQEYQWIRDFNEKVRISEEAKNQARNIHFHGVPNGKGFVIGQTGGTNNNKVIQDGFEFSDVPEGTNSDLYQLFFKDEYEEYYSIVPPEINESLQNYINKNSLEPSPDKDVTYFKIEDIKKSSSRSRSSSSKTSNKNPKKSKSSRGGSSSTRSSRKMKNKNKNK